MRPFTVSHTRRTLTRVQAAEAAAQNVQRIGDIDTVAKIVADLICGWGTARRTLPSLLGSEVALANLAEQWPISITATPTPGKNAEAIRSWLLAQASPSGNEEVLTWIVSDMLRDRLDAHADALEDLSVKYPELYEAFFKHTLLKALRIGKRADICRERLARLLADHARFVLVGIAHNHIARIRQIATSPFGHHFSGFNHWKSAGHVLLATVAEPALAVEQVYRQAFSFKGSDEAVRKELVSKTALADSPAGALVLKAALAVQVILKDRNASPSWVETTLVSTVGPLKSLALISAKDVANAGLARSSMSSVWFGLEPSELATYVAIELLKALNAVDAVVEAALDNKKASPDGTTPSDTKAAFAATLLRAEGQPDRESLQIGRARGCNGGISPDSKGSRYPLVSLKTKLSDPDVAAAARTFCIDAGRLFEG